MTAPTRASMFDDTELDISGFAPKPGVAGADRAQVRAAAGPAFRSREPEAAAPPRAPRRHRTGRNVQLNLKVRQQDADAFYVLADEKGWVLGEAFALAVAALRRQSDS